MISKILMWIGGIVMRFVDKNASPVEVSKEEMDKAKKHIEECIELDKKNKEGVK